MRKYTLKDEFSLASLLLPLIILLTFVISDV